MTINDEYLYLDLPSYPINHYQRNISPQLLCNTNVHPFCLS